MPIPFGDIVGLHEAKKALRLLLVDRQLGSLLLSGLSGTGKSTLLGSLYSLLPREELVRIPTSVSYDRLQDCLDSDALLQEGCYRVRPGILSQLSGKVVLLDNLNLFPETILRTILAHHSTVGGYTIVAAFNPEEGGISSGLLDRFALFVELTNSHDLATRVNILRTAQLSKRPTQECDQQIEQGKEWMERVQVSDTDRELAATICREAFVLGHRADIALLRAARAHAAISGREQLKRTDFLAVKDLVLAHRLNQPMQEPPSPPQPEEREEMPPKQNQSHQPPQQPPQGESSGRFTETPPTFSPDALAREKHSPIGEVELLLDPITLAQRKLKQQAGFGTRVKCTESCCRGHFTRAIYPPSTPFEIALTATIRAAAPFQKSRPKREEVAVNIYPSDYRAKKKEHRTGYSILFLVDASGSMGVQQRMSTVKAVIFELLKTAYIKRDTVGMMTFRGDDAEMILPFTRSFTRAKELLSDLKTGGRTPLYLGLRKSYEMIAAERRKHPSIAPVLVLVTDGRATSAKQGENRQDNLQEWAQRVAHITTKTVVVDTEQGFIRLGKAAELATIMGADLYPLDDMIKISTRLKTR